MRLDYKALYDLDIIYISSMYIISDMRSPADQEEVIYEIASQA